MRQQCRQEHRASEHELLQRIKVLRAADIALAKARRAKLVLMPSRVQPKRIIINGHPTSIRLEPACWGWLLEVAAECGMTAKAFIEGVVAAKDPKCPLASALRLYIANYFRSSAPRYGLVDPASRLAFRIERPRRSRKAQKRTKPPSRLSRRYGMGSTIP